MALVDILLPVRNGAAFLAPAITSIVAQRLGDWRLLVLDHGSTDGSGDIVARFGAADARIEHHFLPNAEGLGALLNEGLERSDAKFVARLDADDLATPERLTLQVAAFAREPALAIVGSNYAVIDADGRQQGVVTLPQAPDAIAAASLFSNPVAHPAVMMQRALLDRYGARYDRVFLAPREAIDPRWAEDYLLFGQLAIERRCRNLPERLLHYRRHGAAVGHTRAAAQQVISTAVGRLLMQQLCHRLGCPAPDAAPFSNYLATVPDVAPPGRADDAWRQVERIVVRAFGDTAEVRRELAFRRIFADRGTVPFAVRSIAFAARHRMMADEAATLRSVGKRCLRALIPGARTLST